MSIHHAVRSEVCCDKGYSILLNFDIDRHCGEYTYLEKAAQVAAFNKCKDKAQVDAFSEHYVLCTQ